MRKLVTTLIALSSFAACSGSNTSSSNPIPLDQVPAELAKSFCAAEQACNPFFYGVAFQNADCVAQFTKQFQEASYNDIQNAVTAGTVKYDGNSARTCADAISAGSCAVLDNNAPDSCQQALTGTVAAGAACDIDQECIGLSRCDVTGGTCPGTCAPRASAGVACGKDGDCALGFVCSPITSLCVAPGAVGAQCKGTVAGNCSAGLICIGNDDSKKIPGTCMTAATTLTQASGDTCDLQAGPWCDDGSACVVQSLSGATLTSKCEAAAAAGGPCGIGIPNVCPTGQYCPLALADLVKGTYTASCTALPTEGQACGPAISLARCAANLVCDDTTTPAAPVCITPIELGNTCSNGSLCYSQNCVKGACVPASPCAM